MIAITSSLSGMIASTAALGAIASNVANAQSTGSLSPGGKQAYQPVDVVQTSTSGGGVQATYRPANPGTQAAYSPDSPDADADGMVSSPVSDPVQQSVAMMISANAYKMNAKVLEAGDQMEQTAINMLA